MTELVHTTVEISAGNADDLEALRAELRGRPGIRLEDSLEPVKPGTQGSAIEFFTAACSGGAITVFLQIIKTLVESRGPSCILKIRRGRNLLEVHADNIDEMMPLLKELISGS